MPETFYFTEQAGYVVGGRFRKPGFIPPEMLAYALNEVFSCEPSKDVPNTTTLEGVLRGDCSVIAKGIRTGEVFPLSITDDRFRGMVRIPSKRKWNFHLDPGKHEGYKVGRSTVSSFDINVHPKPYGAEIVARKPVFNVIQIPAIPEGIVARIRSNVEEALAFYSREYWGMMDHGDPDELSRQDTTRVSLDFSALNTRDRAGRLRNSGLINELFFTFYRAFRNETISRTLQMKGFDLTPELPSSGDRYEVESACLRCGGLITAFGASAEDAEICKMSTYRCDVCGVKGPFRVIYSRPLKESEAEWFSHMAMMAADSAD